MLIPNTELDVIYCPNCESLDTIMVHTNGTYFCSHCEDEGNLEDLLFCPSCESNHIVESEYCGDDDEDSEEYYNPDSQYFCYSCEHISERYYELIKYYHKK